MMHQARKPLLSICIPTYNRAELLRSALLSVLPQVEEFKDEVELVVSDNCSTDNTREVVEWARQFGPFSYHRNTENIGGARNFLFITNKLALGEFCWILGDDDFVRVGGVATVLRAIKTYPEIDYVFVSLCHILIEDLRKFPAPVASRDLPDDLPSDNRIGEDRYLEKWETLIAPEISGVFLGGVQVSVFRSALWRASSTELVIGEAYSSLEATYPHIKILAQCMVGKKAFYIGTPQVVVVNGSREWWDLVPMITLVRLNEAIDLYAQVGVDLEQIECCRKSLMSVSGDAIIKLFLKPSMPGWEHISLRKFFARYWRYKELWLSLILGVMKLLIPGWFLARLKKIIGK